MNLKSVNKKFENENKISNFDYIHKTIKLTTITYSPLERKKKLNNSPIHPTTHTNV
jgi:hypothetical protein